MLIFWILGFSIGAIAGTALLLAIPTVVRDRLVPLLISYVTGTLLGAAFLLRRIEAESNEAAIEMAPSDPTAG